MGRWRKHILLASGFIVPRRAAATPTRTPSVVASCSCTKYLYRSVLVSALRWPVSPSAINTPACVYEGSRGRLNTIHARVSSPLVLAASAKPAAAPLWNSGQAVKSALADAAERSSLTVAPLCAGRQPASVSVGTLSDSVGLARLVPIVNAPRPTASAEVRGASDHSLACCAVTASGSSPPPPCPPPPPPPPSTPSDIGVGHALSSSARTSRTRWSRPKSNGPTYASMCPMPSGSRSPPLSVSIFLESSRPSSAPSASLSSSPAPASSPRKPPGTARILTSTDRGSSDESIPRVDRTDLTPAAAPARSSRPINEYAAAGQPAGGSRLHRCSASRSGTLTPLGTLASSAAPKPARVIAAATSAAALAADR